MIEIRPYESADRDLVLSWIGDERTFYRWSAGRLGDYPPAPEKFDSLEGMKRATATNDGAPVGFFTARTLEGKKDELRFGFVIVDPAKRGQGIARQMLTLGLRRAFGALGARRASIAVFDDNIPALRCYKALGFRESGEREICVLCGEERGLTTLAIERTEFDSEKAF